MIGVINYGMGNLRSVVNAFTAVGASVELMDDPAHLQRVNRVVLPGVGAFGDGIRTLRSAGWVEALDEEVRRKGKLFLGICLGMQLLATVGTEHGRHTGLGWVSGSSLRLPAADGLRLPHIGWNDVSFTQSRGLYKGLTSPQSFYFVHSYTLQPDNSSVITGITEYGADFVASVEVDNVFATQFHPEKSHRAGLTVLKNFLELADA